MDLSLQTASGSGRADRPNSYKKGCDFEAEFAKFMTKKLDWTTYRIRAHMPGKSNNKGNQIDIVLDRLDERGQKFNKATKVLAYTCLVLIIGGAWIGYDSDWKDAQANTLIEYGVYLEFAAIATMLLGKHYNKENAWVECKNLKGKATYDQVSKSIQQFEDYKKSGNTEYKFKEHYFVSANGFVENALKLAHDNGIICYEKINGKFVEVSYWNE